MSETAIRIFVGSIFLCLLAIALPFRIRSNRANDKLDRVKNEGKGIFFAIRLAGFSMWIICILYPFFPRLFDAVSFPSNTGLQITGLAMVLLSLPLTYWLFKSIGKNITDTVATRAEHQLITTGVYKYIQHPLYVSAFLISVGMGLLMSNWLLLICSAITLTGLYIRTKTEEQNLLDRFGDDYRQYQSRTGRFFPFKFKV